MDTNNSSRENIQAPTPRRVVRAVIEFVDGNLKIYPIADSDADERRILDALQFVREGL